MVKENAPIPANPPQDLDARILKTLQANEERINVLLKTKPKITIEWGDAKHPNLQPEILREATVRVIAQFFTAWIGKVMLVPKKTIAATVTATHQVPAAATKTHDALEPTATIEKPLPPDGTAPAKPGAKDAGKPPKKYDTAQEGAAGILAAIRAGKRKQKP